MFSFFPGAGELRPRHVSSGPVSELVPPVLDRGGAPAEIEGTVQGGGGVGADGLPESLGTTRLSIVRWVSLVFYLHVEDRKSPHILGQIRSSVCNKPFGHRQRFSFHFPPQKKKRSRIVLHNSSSDTELLHLVDSGCNPYWHISYLLSICISSQGKTFQAVKSNTCWNWELKLRSFFHWLMEKGLNIYISSENKICNKVVFK